MRVSAQFSVVKGSIGHVSLTVDIRKEANNERMDKAMLSQFVVVLRERIRRVFSIWALSVPFSVTCWEPAFPFTRRVVPAELSI